MPRNVHDNYFNTVVYCLETPTAMMQTLIPNFGYLGGTCIRRVVSFQAQAPKDWAESWAEARRKLQVVMSRRVSCNVTYSCTLHTNGYLKVWNILPFALRRSFLEGSPQALFGLLDKETEGWAWWAWMSRYIQSLLYCLCPNRKVVPIYVSNHRETLCYRNVLADEEVYNSWLQEVCPTHFVWCHSFDWLWFCTSDFIRLYNILIFCRSSHRV